MPKVKSSNSSFSTIVFICSLIPAGIIAFSLNSYLNQIGISFLLVFLIVTLWLSLFITCVVSLYRNGELTWGNIDSPTSNDIRFDILVFILMGLVALSVRLLPSSFFKRAKSSFIKSLGLGLFIATLSILPFIFIVWISLIVLNLV